MENEKQRIDKAVADFSKLMASRMHDKRAARFSGWKNPEWRKDIERRLLEKAVKCLQGFEEDKDLVDIANFAMMLHGFRQQTRPTE